MHGVVLSGFYPNDSILLPPIEMPDAGVSREEMLGAESQNMFDFYDNDGEEEVDSDSEEDASTGARGFVLPRGSVQMAGEGSELARNAIAVRQRARALEESRSRRPTNGEYAGSGEPTDSGRNGVHRRVRQPTSASGPVEEPAIAHGGSASANVEGALAAREEAEAEARRKWEEASERALRRWAAANNVDLPSVMPACPQTLSA